MKEKKCIDFTVEKEVFAYVVGVEYDDFSEGGFAIIAVCDNLDTANKMIEKAYREFPTMKKNSVSIRTIKFNKFYDNWI